ncbi:STAS domain-containing protein [Mucisphaera sp.]|uniref:STAS domain-containing protein n=1 Tax=Mucisphaera sp. TaxID=2913024 RepID=UPI003D0E9BE7
MTILDHGDDLTVIVLEGTLDISGVNEVETRFNVTIGARHRATVVDLSGVDFMASLGIGMLVSAATATKKSGKPFFHCGGSAGSGGGAGAF